MTRSNFEVHDFHKKVDWLLKLPRGIESQMPRGFPSFETRKDFARELGVGPNQLSQWCPKPENYQKVEQSGEQPKKADQTNRPPVHFVRNVARVFGFAPPDSIDDDEVWRKWWATCWPSFTPTETDGKHQAPFSVFERHYLEALKAGELVCQPPIVPEVQQRQSITSERPLASLEMTEISRLIDTFRAEFAAEPRFGNTRQFILDLIEGIRDLPDPSRWSEEHFDHLLNVQLALDYTLRHADPGAGVDTIHFGSLVPLLRALAALLVGRQVSDAYSVIDYNKLARYVRQVREAIRNLPTTDIPPPVRYKVKVLDQYLEIAERSARINLKHVDDMAARIRQYQLGALHKIERLTAVLIGKRLDRAPNLAMFRDELQGGGFGPELVIIPAGQFQMGSAEGEGEDDEHPQHEVRIAKRFAVGVCPATRGEFAAFHEASTYTLEDDRWRNPRIRQDNDHPVINVSWYDSHAYVGWLKEKSGGKPYRLLSEAEWEYCCRAGTGSAYETGDSITPAQANFESRGTTSAFKFAPNAWRLRGMHGNVWEWCQDSWHDNYNGHPPTDGSAWNGGDESLRVLRGGSWRNNPQNIRSATRNKLYREGRMLEIGFRVARTL
jgi:formylglycine-generating enzyme required for sulfatase activity